MSIVRTTVLLILALTCLAQLTVVKGECAKCCFGKWYACLTGCATFNECDAHCNSALRRCQNSCPGSRAVNNIRLFRKAFIKKPKKLKIRRKLRKHLRPRHWKRNMLLDCRDLVKQQFSCPQKVKMKTTAFDAMFKCSMSRGNGEEQVFWNPKLL